MAAEILTPPKDVYFSVALYHHKDIIGTTVVWADADVKTPAVWQPPPTMTVASGKGTHAYWVVDTMLPIIRAVRLSRLAAMAHRSDPQVCEERRNMRLPGSMNVKYKPPRLCSLASTGGPVYAADELEEGLVASVLSEYWQEGTRHALTLALAALLGRCGWRVERVERVVLMLGRWNGDDDTRDRLQAVRGTYERMADGQFASAAELKDAMGSGPYKKFNQALGSDSRDGDLLLDGEKVGSIRTIQRDIADVVLATREWATVDGNPVRWRNDFWEQATEEVLVSYVFRLLCRLHQVKQGVEEEFAGTSALAKAIKDVVIGDLQSEALPAPEEHWLPVANGVLDLQTRELAPHDRKYRSRWVLPVAYEPTATCPTWLRFLEETAPTLGDFLQEWVGYVLRAGNPWQRMLWIFGPSGTGKSTFLQAVGDLLGPACVPVKSGQLDDYGKAILAPARVAVCSELSTRLLRTADLKALVASDPVVGRHPYGRPFSVVFRGKFLWASNSLPPVDQSEGLWRRIAVAPFVIVPPKADPLLSGKIRAELSGILNWALDGLARVESYLDDGDWALPQAVEEQVDEYRQAADTFKAFAADELLMDPEKECPTHELYLRYVQWAKDRGYQPEPMGPVFWRELRSIGLEPIKSPRKVGKRLVRMWKGAELAPSVF